MIVNSTLYTQGINHSFPSPFHPSLLFFSLLFSFFSFPSLFFFFFFFSFVNFALATKLTLKHTYFALRHAESIPNTKRMIVSDPEHGCKEENGLSDRGVQQATQADLSVSTLFLLPPPFISFSSSSPSLLLLFLMERKLFNDETILQSEELCVLSSDFSRAMQTAKIVNARLPHPTDIKPCVVCLFLSSSPLSSSPPLFLSSPPPHVYRRNFESGSLARTI